MKYWVKELERAAKSESTWFKKAKAVVDRYVDERVSNEDVSSRFNILWSNTETLRPALISSTPRPECRPRYQKKDPVARIAAAILERAIEFSVDQYDFVRFGRKVVQDYLLPGRGVARIKYTPVIEKKKEREPLKLVERAGEHMWVDSKGKPAADYQEDDEGPFQEVEREEVIAEDVRAERVPWKWFRMEPADCWDNVNWIAFGAPYTMDEGKREWGKKFATAAIDSAKDDKSRDKALENKVIVWEIWDKRSRQQIFMVEGVDEYLEKNDDPLGLEHFFPIVEPIYIVENNDTMVPTPEFCLWQDQADELDRLSERIRRVTEAIRARGAYAGEEQTKLTNILTADDNELVPVEDWMSFIDKGGLDGIISWVPIDVFAKVLQILEQQRAIKVQEIYELTGVSDIMRGASDPRETAKAQMIKDRTGNRRLLTKQDTVQRFFRDVYRLKAEIIAENFDKETLRMMVGLENKDNQLFDAAVEMIKSDVLRNFNVDIETDSTIAADEMKEKEGLAEAMQAISQYLAGIMPLVQTQAIPMPVAMGLLQDYLRKFRFGRKLDDLLEEHAQSQPPNAEQQKAEAEQKAKEAEAQAQLELQKQLHQQAMQQNDELHQQKMQQMQELAQLKAAQEGQKLEQQRREGSQKLVQDEAEHDQELRQDEETHDQKLESERELGKVKVDVQRKQAAARPKPTVQ